MHSPLDQFKIKKLIDIEVFGLDISFTNSALFMAIALCVVALLFIFSIKNKAVVPGRMQTLSEAIYGLVDNIIEGTAGAKGRKYLPLIFSIFIFILSCNLIGMIPYSFTVTSHIAITFALAIFIFIGVTLLGFIKHGFHYLSLFLPKGTPKIMALPMIFIELLAYLARPISLSVRLAANMMAGHIVLKLLASFVIMGGAFLGFLPFGLLTIMQGFEIFVAVLQAYIFTILTCAYLSDALNLH